MIIRTPAAMDSDLRMESTNTTIIVSALSDMTRPRGEGLKVQDSVKRGGSLAEINSFGILGQ